MMIHERDAAVLEYARRQGLPWYYVEDADALGGRLTVHHGCVTATFRRGRMVEVKAAADRELFDVMFESLTRLFALSAAATGEGSASPKAPSDDRNTFNDNIL
ncbi:MAG: hypothetical protein BroJett003_18150 [Planctomycetota bacterium]|nr:MAG: hypothetical protein BroJett003_18150 [Planctomycetota bacterium]